MIQTRPDWHLIVGIVGVVVAVVAAIPSSYEFIEDRFFTESTPSSSESMTELDTVKW